MKQPRGNTPVKAYSPEKMRKIILASFGGAILGLLLIWGAIIATVLFVLNDFQYGGLHHDLYTVAVNNVFGIKGYCSNGEFLYDPEIHILETDSYGRTLFVYNEYYDTNADNKPDYGMAFVVMQHCDEEGVYYYPDCSYLPYFDTTSDWQTISGKLSEDALDQLKADNHWEQPLKKELCVKREFVTERSEGKLRPDGEVFDRIIFPYKFNQGYRGTDRNFYQYSIFCGMDAYGRELHYVYGKTANPTNFNGTMYATYEFAIVLEPDGTCPENGIIQLPVPEESADAIQALKQAVSWNQPLD